MPSTHFFLYYVISYIHKRSGFFFVCVVVFLMEQLSQPKSRGISYRPFFVVLSFLNLSSQKVFSHSVPGWWGPWLQTLCLESSITLLPFVSLLEEFAWMNYAFLKNPFITTLSFPGPNSPKNKQYSWLGRHVENQLMPQSYTSHFINNLPLENAYVPLNYFFFTIWH